MSFGRNVSVVRGEILACSVTSSGARYCKTPGFWIPPWSGGCASDQEELGGGLAEQDSALGALSLTALARCPFRGAALGRSTTEDDGRDTAECSDDGDRDRCECGDPEANLFAAIGCGVRGGWLLVHVRSCGRMFDVAGEGSFSVLPLMSVDVRDRIRGPGLLSANDVTAEFERPYKPPSPRAARSLETRRSPRLASTNRGLLTVFGWTKPSRMTAGVMVGQSSSVTAP